MKIAVKRFTVSSVLILTLFTTIACEKESPDSELTSNFNFTTESYGCSSFVVYKFNTEKDATIAVIGKRENLNLSTSEQSFDLSSINENDLKVEIKKFADVAGSYYCDDVMGDDPEVLNSWRGKNGIVKIKIVEDNIGTNPAGKPEYRISVKLEDVDFEDANGEKVKINYLEFNDVYVGWLPG